MNKEIIQIKLGAMRKRAREDAGISQDKLASMLGVSKKSVQNWESGICSPSEYDALSWFHALNLSPLRYYLQFLYPDTFYNIESDKDVDNALEACIKGLSPARKRKLLYMLQGKHGSTPFGILELVITHLHLPMSVRVTMAQILLTNYEIAAARSDLKNTDEIMPDIDLLRQSLTSGMKAAMNSQETYNATKDDKHE